MESRTIRFIRRGELVSLANVPSDRTLLELLREDLGATGTKEGCGEGDCGACTVVVAEPQAGRLRWRAINACIRLAHSIDGMALWTVEDLAAPDGTLHPAQEAMVRAHGSQCGFCTPGFVMSLFGMYQNHVARGEPVTRELAQQALSGNLCRCTGYRPILDAACEMASLPRAPVDEPAIVRQLEALAQRRALAGASGNADYMLPQSLPELLQLRAAHPQAQLVAGCTDVGLWVTKQHRRLPRVLDLTQVRELRQVERYEHHLAIGAAVTLADAFDALVAERPQLHGFASRFAGLPVRNAGTLGGNVANGSPIGDAMPLLIALGAHIVLLGVRGHRELPLEHFYTGYRQNVLAADEVLGWIKVPRPVGPHPGPTATPQSLTTSRGPRRPQAGEGEDGAGARNGIEFLRAYKVSKRYDDDISAVCLAIALRIEDGVVAQVGIGAGGVAATPARALRAEATLRGQPWTQAAAQQAADALRAEFRPISDMRASADYRSEVLGNLVQRFWLESQGHDRINLESFRLEEAAAP